MQLAGQGRGQVEPESVDMHFGDPVAQRVHDELQRVWVASVETVARPGVVGVPREVVVVEFVVGAIVDAAETQGRADMVTFGRVVVDDVEDDLDTCLVQCANHCLEFGDGAACVR